MTADPTTPKIDSLTGQTLAGRYKVVELLAKGGMGRIYKAEQIELGRLVALKILDDTTDDPDGFRKRFTLEAATSARLSHPNIVIVHDYGSFDLDGSRRYFMALELIDGRTLSAVVKEVGFMAPGRAAWVAREILRALREAHRQGVVHRDLKPSNVMLVDRVDGEHVKVLDFGIAKVLQHEGEEITRDGAFVGTPRYMAPEQLSGDPVDVRSDLYSLGILLFQMLTGKPPHAGKDMMQVMLASVTEPTPELPEPFASQVPEPLKAIIRRALQRDPRDRFQDASEMLRAIDQVGAMLPGWAGPSTVTSGETSVDRTPHSGERMSAVLLEAATQARKVDSERPTSAGTPARMAAAAAAPAPAPSNRTAAIATAATLLTLMIVALAFVLWPPPAAPDATDTSVVAAHDPIAPLPPATTTPPIATPVAPPTTVASRFRLVIDSVPTGAEVFRDDVRIGTAPQTVELDAQALEQAPASFRLELRGYRPYTLEQGPSASDVTVRAALERAPTPRVVRHTGTGGGTGASPPPPEDRMLKTSR